MAEKIFTVDKFLGLNESADGSTELKLGEAQKIENFYITDGYNLASRPGIRKFAPTYLYSLSTFLWSGIIGGKKCLLWGNAPLRAYCADTQKYYDVIFPKSFRILRIVQIGVSVFLMLQDQNTGELATPELFWRDTGAYNGLDIRLRSDGSFLEEPYIPLVISECTPAGAGVEQEKLNILTDKFRVQFTVTEGLPGEYVLPEMASDVIGVHFAGAEMQPEFVGNYNAATHTFTIEGGNESFRGDVIFVCTTDDADLKAAREKFLSMPYHEYFNGATDTRIFFYGDGSNVCYYSGHPAFAFEYGYGDYLGAGGSDNYTRDGTHNQASLYVPAGNEIAVDFSDSPITAMVRHYSRLLVFKPDGTDAITYEPVTLEDGSVIAGFYLRPVNREFGNDAPGQVVLINNNPRSFSKGSIYEWRISSGYRDERNAKCISQKVARTVAAADPAKLKVFDDGVNKTYYVFLNDEDGTVLVNRYDLDAWSIYKSHLTRNVSHCLLFDGKMCFLNDGTLYYFDPDYLYDEATDGGDPVAIDAVWESGFHSFGADYLRKHSSRLWLSILPQSASGLDITVRTDKSSEYLTKTIGYSLMDFAHLDFSNFSFLTYAAPKIRRVQMKVKKFVYYKLILRLPKPGTRVTVLGYDQQVRYSSNVK